MKKEMNVEYMAKLHRKKMMHYIIEQYGINENSDHTNYDITTMQQ